MDPQKKEDYKQALKAMFPMSFGMLTACFLIGWLPFFLGMQKHWYWALLASLLGPSLALPLNFSSRLSWIRRRREIERLIEERRAK